MAFDEFEGAKPFLKWAGGKTQLIPAIQRHLPSGIGKIKNLTYMEPFVGSGAVMFWFLRIFPNVEKAIINDINPDLIIAYQTIKKTPQELIACLEQTQAEYYELNSEKKRKAYFIEKRAAFNRRDLDPVTNTCLLIFLNRTCYNGLYRVNGRNEFNVPFGRYNKPGIADKKTLLADSRLLQKVTILNGDFEDTLSRANGNTFFYLDPPYKAISPTAYFSSYTKDSFDDTEQKRLKTFCEKLDASGHSWLLSNSDVKNIDPDNHFFDDLYSEFEIRRVKAKRAINSVKAKRGEIYELLISNYEIETALPV
jgi:DNA adenine methylase